jgi:hypothetical protein
MTYQDLVDEANARVRNSGGIVPDRLLLREMGVFQSELFQRAAVWNPEYYGICVTATLTAGALDLNGLVPALQQAASIQRIEVFTVTANPAAPAIGARISVVPLEDPTSGLAPRVTLRDNVLRQVGSELALVTGVELYYSRLPNPVLPTSGAVEAELREPWQQLLVLHCANYLSLLLQAEGIAVPEGLVKRNMEDEARLLSEYEAHVRGYVSDVEDRFGRTGRR